MRKGKKTNADAAEIARDKSVTRGVKSFAENLRRERIAAGLSQSDLARKIWGTIKTKGGYTAARKRDRISAYESGRQYPNDKTLTQIAKALEKDSRDLVQVPPKNAELRDDEPIQITMLSGHPGRTHLKVNLVTSFEIASKICSMLNESMETKIDAP